ncbi:MAG: peptidylprolyl isomerase [Lachnospiraceae bacterium]|nr:peptidylprolyl isomerase [Lachnospiraceae bacterium]
MKRILILILALILLSGCAQDGKRYVLTSGFEEDEVFFVEDVKCRLPEARVYIQTFLKRYEDAYGPEIWEKKIDGKSLAERIKKDTLSCIARLKVIHLLASDMGISLSEKEEAQCISAAKQYMDCLSESDLQYLGLTEEITTDMYREYALAEKVYNNITEGIEPEISDDEARTVLVRQIECRILHNDPLGRDKEYSQEQRMDAYARIHELSDRIEAGEDFDSLADRYNEGSEDTCSIGKDSNLSSSLKEAAFSLAKGQVSGVIETEDGFFLLKCISTLDREETDANKIRILEDKKNEAFAGDYDEFRKTVYSGLNEAMWDRLEARPHAISAEEDFFDVYMRLFPKEIDSAK